MRAVRGKLRHVLARNMVLAGLVILPFSAVRAQLVPPQNLDPSGSAIRLDSSIQSDAWLVYSYDVDPGGRVVDPRIHSSNGVPEVEQAVLQQLRAMRFKPATRNGQAINYPTQPVVYTWILDLPREMSAEFAAIYRQAWDYYAQEDYDAAFEQAVQLKKISGRNALEEVKLQILAAALSSRWQDDAAELQHLQRVEELQSLALDNNFRNRYVAEDQYLKILDRILELQLQAMLLADAGDTLDEMQQLGRGSAVTESAARRYLEAKKAFLLQPEVVVTAELIPLFQGGAGSWESGLTHREFSISDVQGRIGGVYLVCGGSEQALTYPADKSWTVPVGWQDCRVETVGKAGTRFKLHQYAAGG